MVILAKLLDGVVLTLDREFWCVQFRSVFMPPSMRIKVALQFLVDGYQYARDLGLPVEEFPVSLETMQRHAVAEIDLFWLLKKGYAGALWDGVQCEKILLHELTAGINFVATPAGFVFANQWLASQGEFQSSSISRPQDSAAQPMWDHERRELKLGVSLVKRFRVPAPNQEYVLRTFEEDGWPGHLDDPLPPCDEIDPKRRLHDTIIALNRSQTNHRILFRGDGTGCGICWELPSV